MGIRKRIGLVVLALIIALGTLELGSRLAIPGIDGYVTKAEAVVGRPLTPVSVAGVARRSNRR